MSYWVLAFGILVILLAGFCIGRFVRTSADRQRERDAAARLKWQKALEDAVPKEGDWSYQRRYMTGKD